eukprot:Tbor_TRINITY_DN5394_c0_g3::TRINITY_DN5394_c0_g3_i2::g.5210::m.5210
MGYVVPKIRKGPFVTPVLGDDKWSYMAKANHIPDLIVHLGNASSSNGSLTSPSSKAASMIVDGFPNKKKNQYDERPQRYFVNTSTKPFKKAQIAFEQTISTSIGNISALIECWKSHPYHLPLTLELSSSFHTVGDTANSMIFMDLSLHIVGHILTSSVSVSHDPQHNNTNDETRDSSLVPKYFRSAPPLGLARSSLDRYFPYSGSNQLVFETLIRGVHHALNKGCGKVAHEHCRLILGLDNSDPVGAGLLFDYTALRSREWMSIIELQHLLIRYSVTEETSGDIPGQEFIGIPSIHFNAALARHLICSSCESSRKGKCGNGSTKGNRSRISAIQAGILKDSGISVAPSNREPGAQTSNNSEKHQNRIDKPYYGSLLGPISALDALVNAVALFPDAALALGMEIEEKMGDEPWNTLFFEWAELSREIPNMGETLEIREKLSQLFAQRSKDMWKATQHAHMLREAVYTVNSEKLLEKIHLKSNEQKPCEYTYSPHFIGAAQRVVTTIATATASILKSRYSSLPVQNITGAFNSRIPQELLQMEENDGWAQGGMLEDDAILLRRYEAAFGPLDIPHISPSERLEIYGLQLERHIAEIGASHSAISLFFRTLLPWNDIREMAIRRALDEVGEEDPEVIARRMRREYVMQVMDEADALSDDEEIE